MTSIGKRALAAFALVAQLPISAFAQDDEAFLSDDEFFADDFEIETPTTIHDPLEAVNRKIFAFNDWTYMNLLKPVARAYEGVTPDFAERGLSNFFENIAYPERLAGNLLQFKFGGAAKETGKFLVDSTVGLGGFMRPSKNMEKLDTPKENMGQAFGAWGFSHGFYIVLPILGPTSARDGIGMFGDRWAHPVSKPWTLLDDGAERTVFSAVGIVSESPKLINLYDSMTKATIDQYEAIKDGYAQRQKAQIEN